MARRAPTQLPHPGDGPVEGRAVPLLHLGPDLGPEAQGEPPPGQQLEVVGLVGQLDRDCGGRRWPRWWPARVAVVAPAASTSGVKTSWGPSKVKAPSTPSSSSRRAWSGGVLEARAAGCRSSSAHVRIRGRAPPAGAPSRGRRTVGPGTTVAGPVTHWGDGTASLHAGRGRRPRSGPATPSGSGWARPTPMPSSPPSGGGTTGRTSPSAAPSCSGYYTVLTHPGVSYRCGFFGPAERMLLAQGANIELVPGRVPAVRPDPPPLRPEGDDRPGRTARGHGTVNLSLHLGATYDELVLAGRDPDRLLVVEVNPNLPRTCSLGPEYTNTLPLDLIDVLVEADGAPFTLPGHAARRDRPGHRRAGPVLHHRRRHPPDRHRGGAQHGGLPAGRGARAAATGSTARCSPTA